MATAPRRQPLTSKRCVVVVEAGPGLKPTLATKLRQEEAERAAKPEIRAAPSVVHGIIDVFGGDAAQQAAARAAWDAAYVMVNSARVAINSATYNTWFGNPDWAAASGSTETTPRSSARWPSLERGTYPPPKIRYALNLTGDGGCTPGVVAYTYKGFYTIYTCLPFWARPAIGIDLQASTLVHELTTMASEPTTSCMELAKR